LTKLGLTDFSYFEDEFDQVLASGQAPERSNHIGGEDTAFLLETNTNYDKTDMTNIHGTRSRRGSSRPGPLTQDDTVVLINSQNSSFSQKSSTEEKPSLKMKTCPTAAEDDDEGRLIDEEDFKLRAFTYNCKDEESAHPKLSRKVLETLKKQEDDDDDEIDLDYFKYGKSSSSLKKEINLDDSQTVSSQNSLNTDSPKKKKRTIGEDAIDEEVV